MREIEVAVYMFLTLALSEDEWSASAALPPKGSAAGIHGIEGWMGPRV
jgi:hypothetical protein